MSIQSNNPSNFPLQNVNLSSTKIGNHREAIAQTTTPSNGVNGHSLSTACPKEQSTNAIATKAFKNLEGFTKAEYRDLIKERHKAVRIDLKFLQASMNKQATNELAKDEKKIMSDYENLKQKLNIESKSLPKPTLTSQQKIEQSDRKIMSEYNQSKKTIIEENNNPSALDVPVNDLDKLEADLNTQISEKSTDSGEQSMPEIWEKGDQEMINSHIDSLSQDIMEDYDLNKQIIEIKTKLESFPLAILQKVAQIEKRFTESTTSQQTEEQALEDQLTRAGEQIADNNELLKEAAEISITNNLKTEETGNPEKIGRAERDTLAAAKEVHTTEITYVENLRDLNRRTSEMQKDYQPKEIIEFGKQLETQLKSLLPSSTRYLSGLDEAMKKTDLEVMLNGICDNYSKNADTLFKPFEEYTQKFDGFLTTLGKLNKEYPAQMQSLNSPIPNALNLQSLLIQPIQRGPRHVMTPTEVAGNFIKLNNLKDEGAKNLELADKLSDTIDSNKKRMDIVNQSKKLFDVDSGLTKLQDFQKKIGSGYKGKMKDSELVAAQSMRSRFDGLGVGSLNRGKVGVSDPSMKALKTLYDTLKKLEKDIEPLKNQDELDSLNPELKPHRENLAAQLNDLRENLKIDKWVSKSLASLKFEDLKFSEFNDDDKRKI